MKSTYIDRMDTYPLRFADDYGGPGQVALATHVPAKLSVGETKKVKLNKAEAAHFRRDRCYVLGSSEGPPPLRAAPDEEKKKTKKTKEKN